MTGKKCIDTLFIRAVAILYFLMYFLAATHRAGAFESMSPVLLLGSVIGIIGSLLPKRLAALVLLVGFVLCLIGYNVTQYPNQSYSGTFVKSLLFEVSLAGSIYFFVLYQGMAKLGSLMDWIIWICLAAFIVYFIIAKKDQYYAGVQGALLQFNHSDRQTLLSGSGFYLYYLATTQAKLFINMFVNLYAYQTAAIILSNWVGHFSQGLASMISGDYDASKNLVDSFLSTTEYVPVFRVFSISRDKGQTVLNGRQGTTKVVNGSLEFTNGILAMILQMGIILVTFYISPFIVFLFFLIHLGTFVKNYRNANQ
ncbi:hypothetical protein [Companilactobacillus mishanensis]|uniref:Uncharacterized protein n=1 Tax=Companilactobacillus mishanensis TaxID=2486008 RepID=A0A5P0ZJ44_9LACO|nr:hypothetical protein [Companilactobacillus mishanensis]MQS53120.1 hypothetical protein [Companilactobacillus mishanensis]